MAHMLKRASVMVGLALALTAVTAQRAYAHCDTMDGPVVTAARAALAAERAEGVLIWVRAQDDAEIRRAFARTLAVRKLGAEARALADYHFFETLVRLHRTGEGEPYTGLEPACTDHGPAVPAADRAVASGSLHELEELLVSAVRDGLRERFERTTSAKVFTPGDVAAGRAYVAAYVPLLHYVESVHALATTKSGHAPAAHAATPGASHTGH